MAVLIRDMEMPKSCIYCVFCHECECILTGQYPLDDELIIGYMVHPDECPLEEVTWVAGMYKTQRGEDEK